MSNTIDVQSTAVIDILSRLAERTGDVTPYLLGLGEDIMERTKQRFETSTGPDGKAWAPNSAATLRNYLKNNGVLAKVATAAAKGGKGGASKPDVWRINSLQAMTTKKPLIAGGLLSQQIFPRVADGSLTVTSSRLYAFMQQFGGTKGQFPHLWGDIPARPFFPVMPDGALYSAEEAKIVEGLRQYLTL